MLAAIAGIGLLTSIPSLPPGAFAVHPAPGAVQSQSLTTSAATIAPPGRDTFAISTFSVVQWPVPVSTPVSSGFGFRNCDGCPALHNGLDVNPGSGYPIRSISAGLVTEAGWDSTGYGNRVIVQHVIDGRTVSSLYAHMRDGSIAVSVGETVTRGQRMGLVGSTGVSTGAHLHLGILQDGEFIDPYRWLVEHVNV